MAQRVRGDRTHGERPGQRQAQRPAAAARRGPCPRFEGKRDLARPADGRRGAPWASCDAPRRRSREGCGAARAPRTGREDKEGEREVREDIKRFNNNEFVKKTRKIIGNDEMNESFERRRRNARNSIYGINVPEKARRALEKEYKKEEDR